MQECPWLPFKHLPCSSGRGTGDLDPHTGSIEACLSVSILPNSLLATPPQPGEHTEMNRAMFPQQCCFRGEMKVRSCGPPPLHVGQLRSSSGHRTSRWWTCYFWSVYIQVSYRDLYKILSRQILKENSSSNSVGKNKQKNNNNNNKKTIPVL